MKDLSRQLLGRGKDAIMLKHIRLPLHFTDHLKAQVSRLGAGTQHTQKQESLTLVVRHFELYPGSFKNPKTYLNKAAAAG